MYHEESNKPTRARTSNLNEELGMVRTNLFPSSVRAATSLVIGDIPQGEQQAHQGVVVEPHIGTRLGEGIETCRYDPSSLVIDETARGEQHAHRLG